MSMGLQNSQQSDLPHREPAAQELARQISPIINKNLRQLGEALWSTVRLFGIFPIHTYRLRFASRPGAFTWWIERDIPPYDLHRCEAYRVRLVFTASGKPILLGQSGRRSYSVNFINNDAIEACLASLYQDPPLLIPREMGAVEDD